MSRAAIYARYSSDPQRDASIEDQVRLCRERLEREAGARPDLCRSRDQSGASTLPAGLAARCSRTPRRRSSTSSSPRRSTGSAATRRTSPALYKQLTFAGVRDRHARRGRDQRAACRPQGHDERALPQGPRRQDAARPARPRRGRAVRRRQLPMAMRSCASSPRRRAAARRRVDQRGRGRDRPPHLPRLRRRASRRAPSPHRSTPRACPARGQRLGRARPSTATGSAAPASSTTSSISAGWSGTGCATSRTRRPASACPAPNPPSDWIVEEVPDLRIVDDALWQAVQGAARRRLAKPGRRGSALKRAPAPASFSLRPPELRLLRRRLSTIGQGPLGCSPARNKGTCDNRLSIAADASRRRPRRAAGSS